MKTMRRTRRCTTLAEFAAYARRHEPEYAEGLRATIAAQIAGHPGVTGVVLFEGVGLDSSHLGEQYIVLCAEGGEYNFAHPREAEGKTYKHWSIVPVAYWEREGSGVATCRCGHTHAEHRRPAALLGCEVHGCDCDRYREGRGGEGQ